MKEKMQVDKMKYLAAQLKAGEIIQPSDVKYSQSVEMIALVSIFNKNE